jgi:hypothetical protein
MVGILVWRGSRFTSSAPDQYAKGEQYAIIATSGWLYLFSVLSSEVMTQLEVVSFRSGGDMKGRGFAWRSV